MYNIAIIQFPGTNCEYESARIVKKTDMEPEFFRWNKNREELRNYDGYFIPGGFSYEDRVRSGAIAAHDPLMEVVAEEAAKGKPVIGICNGAQILVEAGMIPGLNTNHIGASLAWNEKGYLNIYVNIKNDAQEGRSVFNNFATDWHFRLPIAHGEGRYVIPKKLLQQLIDNGQTVFRYCNDKGEVVNEYPVNPNGAVYNLAGVCNPAGNILALMPHPERTEEGIALFESMKKYLDSRLQAPCSIQDLEYDTPNLKLEEYDTPENTMELLVDLIITDNEAQTLQIALEELGLSGVKVRRFSHFEIGLIDGVDRAVLADDLIKSGELLNTNKEIPYVDDRSPLTPHPSPLEGEGNNSDWHTILVRYQDDFDGMGRLHTLQNRLGVKDINAIKKGVVWQIECSEEKWQKILDSHILFNPYSQTVFNIHNT